MARTRLNQIKCQTCATAGAIQKYIKKYIYEKKTLVHCQPICSMANAQQECGRIIDARPFRCERAPINTNLFSAGE